jgi:hypothetical protein
MAKGTLPPRAERNARLSALDASLEAVALRRAARIVRRLMTPNAKFPTRDELEGARRATRRLEATRAPQHAQAA